MASNHTHAVRLLSMCCATVTMLVLGGCGASSPSSESNNDAQVTELGDPEGSVSILAWPGYVEDGSDDPDVDWVSKFEEDTGCAVTSKTYGTSDEAYSLMKADSGYDVIAASGDLTLRLINSKLVQPLNTDLIDSYENVYSFLKNRDFNSVDGVTYGVPHGYGANMLMYNKSSFPEEPTSWDVMLDSSKASQYQGKIGAYDSPIYIADAALYLMKTDPSLGIENPYALDEDQLQAAVDLLKEQNANVGEYWSDYLKLVQSFQSGDTQVATSWQIIYNELASDEYGIVMPEEGATGWSDSWMINANTEHTTCAYKWLDYIDSPEINAQATEYFGEAPATPDACDYAEDPDFCTTYHAGDEDFEKQIWYWTTPISECLDGRTDVECTDYQKWTTAWQEIKG